MFDIICVDIKQFLVKVEHIILAHYAWDIVFVGVVTVGETNVDELIHSFAIEGAIFCDCCVQVETVGRIVHWD